MARKRAPTKNDTTTELKIKNAARAVFHKKGFAATRTRDIAEEAGINLALLNYYFRSKKKLFDIIMMESLQQFALSVGDVFNDEKTSFGHKLHVLSGRYIDMLTAHPDIPLFILSELRANPQELISKVHIKENLLKSHFIHQFNEQVKSGKISSIPPLQFMINFMGLIVFPFVASPIVKGIGDLSDDEFTRLMQERKALIPKWLNAMFEV